MYLGRRKQTIKSDEKTFDDEGQTEEDQGTWYCWTYLIRYSLYDDVEISLRSYRIDVFDDVWMIQPLHQLNFALNNSKYFWSKR